MPYGFKIKTNNRGVKSIELEDGANITALEAAVKRGDADAIAYADELTRVAKIEINRRRQLLYKERRKGGYTPLQRSFINQELREMSADVAGLNTDPAHTLRNIYSRNKQKFVGPTLTRTSQERHEISARVGRYQDNQTKALVKGVNTQLDSGDLLIMDDAEARTLREAYRIITNKDFDTLIDDEVLKVEYRKGDKTQLYRAIENAYNIANSQLNEAAKFGRLDRDQIDELRALPATAYVDKLLMEYFKR